VDEEQERQDDLGRAGRRAGRAGGSAKAIQITELLFNIYASHTHTHTVLCVRVLPSLAPQPLIFARLLPGRSFSRAARGVRKL
jgi:hypothetical protein